MNLKPRSIIYIALLALGLWTIYLGREVLSPFIFAALFAYLLDPIVSFLSSKGISRALSIAIVYLGMIFLIFATFYALGNRLATEAKDLADEAIKIVNNIEAGKSDLPSWTHPYVLNISESVRSSINLSARQVVGFFSGALNSLVSFMVFLLVMFYFLKDGRKFFRAAENLLPGKSKIEFAIVIQKVNLVIGNYLRAQSFMVIWMTIVIGLILTVLGVRFSLILGLIAGLAELLPYVGPTIAFTIIFLTASLTGGASLLSMPYMYEGLTAALIYLTINQLQNVLIAPQVTARLVKLHPLLVLASVLVGGQLFGTIGVLFAVPIVASFKVVLEHILDLLD